MERYIYINYAYEDYRLVQRIIEDIEKTGVKVYHGSGSEERVAGSVCVIHFWTPAAHTSRSYRKVMNYTLKHELDTMLFHLDGVQMASELDVQLDVLHALFKYKYQMMSRKAKTADVAASVEVKSEAEAGAEELSIKPENVTIKAEAAAAVKSAEEPVEAAKSTAEEPMAKEARVRTENIDETQKKQLQQQETEKTAEPLTTRDDLFAEGMRILETGTTREDGVKAFKYLRQAASQGHTEERVLLRQPSGVRWRHSAVMPRHRVRSVTATNMDRVLSATSKRLSAGMRWHQLRGISRPRIILRSAIRRAEVYIRMSKRQFDFMKKQQQAVMPVHSIIWVTVTGMAKV